MFQVRRDGLQVDPPGVVAVVLHQVSEQELAHRSVLKDVKKVSGVLSKQSRNGANAATVVNHERLGF